jgi:NADH:ubiquinone reductase (H+-translocating)
MEIANNKKKVVIVGGGFAGIETAKGLIKEGGVEVVLITKSPVFEYYPALYKLVTGALSIEVCVPYTKIFKTGSIRIAQDTFLSYDKDKKEVLLESGAREEYDTLVLCVGSEVNFFNIPGIDEYAFPFKSARHALALRQHLCTLLQESKNVPSADLVKRFHVTVVGGGPSGVELAGDLTTYLRRKTKQYGIDPSFVTVDLIESNPRLLRMFPESVSRIAEARLRKLKVNIYTNRVLQEQDLNTITASGMRLDSGTVIWTAGTQLHSTLRPLPLSEKKLVKVSPQLMLLDDENVYVIGDGASAQGSGLAQGAIAQGAYVAKKIVNDTRGALTAPYRGRELGYVVPIGDNWAVFSYKKLMFSGWIAWILRSAIDFHYFTTIVPLSYVFEVFRQGAKYRKES